ncbi:DUF1476 family protein [Ensifer sp. MPMI2T]|nr:DUF1476 family protein [Ensifer sp. MPMI2T]
MELTERKKALEEKYILDFERSLRVRECRDRLLAGWAAHVLDRADAAAYAEEIAEASRTEAGDEDVLRKVLRDFESAGICGRAALDRQHAEKRGNRERYDHQKQPARNGCLIA